MTTIYCVYFGSDDNILCLPLTDSGQGTGSGTSSAASTGAQGLTISEAVPVMLAQLRRAHGGQMDRATAGRPTRGAQGRTDGDRDRGQDGRQRWTWTASDGHGGPQDVPTL